MRVQSLLLAFALLAFPVPAKEDPTPGTFDVQDPQLREDIADCIAKGVSWLKAQQKADGSFKPDDTRNPCDNDPGHTSLALLALIKCDVPVKDPCIQKGFAWLIQQRIDHPYCIGVTLMALESKYDSLKEGLRTGGKAAPARKLSPSSEDLAWASKLVDRLLGVALKDGGWRYVAGEPLSDSSVTQYALLGLHAARHLGVPVKSDPFHRAGDFLLKIQEEKGPETPRVTEGADAADETSRRYVHQDHARGFPYAARHPITGSTTCAGLTGLLVCRSVLQEDREGQDRAERIKRYEKGIWDGLAWLDRNWSVDQNPGGSEWLGYYLYGLERVGVMTGIRRFGLGHDWYEQGARVWTSKITPQGERQGSWAIDTRDRMEDTPFGLLFLRKARIRGYEIGELPEKQKSPEP